MLRAGLVHAEVMSYGLEPDGPLAVAAGTYSPVASETIRNICFYDAMNCPDLAERALDYYFEKQHPNGFMQNFTHYMLETGCVLWGLGEHYRYTRDEQWVARIKDKTLLACEFLIQWRHDSQRSNPDDSGNGLLAGQVADPVDPERSFMLNGYAYLGLIRAAEMFSVNDPAQSQRLHHEAAALKADIRTAFFDSLAHGPVVPLGDGTWCPTAGPWVGASGPVCLFADDRPVWTHGTFGGRDSMLGPMQLIYQEVIAPDEPAAALLVDYHAELFCSRNTAFSQPYYPPHPFVHLHRGETKRFLKAYYNTVASIADREIYAFWEHYYHESPCKISDEAQFLLQTRCMLYMEQGRTLSLLRGIPRAWLTHGQEIAINNMVSYFGAFSLTVTSHVNEGRIDAVITLNPDRLPAAIDIRLPHPDGLRATAVEGGHYDPSTETVCIDFVKPTHRISLRFDTPS